MSSTTTEAASRCVNPYISKDHPHSVPTTNTHSPFAPYIIKAPTQLLNQVLDAFTEDQRAQQVHLLHPSALRCGTFAEDVSVFHQDASVYHITSFLVPPNLHSFFPTQPVAVLKGGLAAFERHYPFMVKGNELFLDQEFPSEVGL